MDELIKMAVATFTHTHKSIGYCIYWNECNYCVMVEINKMAVAIFI